MKTEMACKKDNIASAAAYLANNIQFVCDDLAPSRQGSFVQCGNSILFMILPKFHRGQKIDCTVETGSMLAEVALLKLMQVQSQEIINHIRESDHKFADWVGRCLMGFIAKAARKYEERHLNIYAGEYIS